MLKQFLLLGFFVSMILVSGFEGGDGTYLSPRGVKNCTDLQNISLDTSSSGQGLNTGNYILLNDIDCSGIPTFTTICPTGGAGCFYGSLNGNYHTVSNLNVTNNFLGTMMVVSLLPSRFFNIKFVNLTITCASGFCGLIGNPAGVFIQNVSVQGSMYANLTTGTGGAGGIIGYGNGGARYEGLANDGFNIIQVSTNSYTGGVCGRCDTGGTVWNNSYNRGNITTNGDYCAGVVGFPSTVNNNLVNYGVINCTSATNKGAIVARASVCTSTCYFEQGTSIQNQTGANSVTSANMVNVASFSNLNFVTFWNMTNGSTKPTLKFVNDTLVPPLTIAGIFNLTPSNNSFTYNSTPTISFRGVFAGVNSVTYYLNGTAYGTLVLNESNNTQLISITQNQSIMNGQYYYGVNATTMLNQSQRPHVLLNIGAISTGTASCVEQHANWRFIPDGCVV